MLEKLYKEKWSQRDGLGALIISPTRELALQTFKVLKVVGRHHDFSADVVIGGKVVQHVCLYNNNTNNNNTIANIYGAVITIARDHPVHLMNVKWCQGAANSLRPSQMTWAVSPPVGCKSLHQPLPFIIIVSLKADTHFTIPRRV